MVRPNRLLRFFCYYCFGLFPSADQILFLKVTDIRQVTVLLLIIKTVPHHKLIGNHEADIVDVDALDHTPVRFVQKCCQFQALRVSLAEVIQQVGKCIARINDIFHDQNISALDRFIEVLDQTDNAAGFGSVGVAGYAHKVHRHGAVQMLGQVYDIKDAAL